MQAPWKQAASMTVAACISAALVGCKRPVEQADQSVRAQLSEGIKALPGAPEKAIPDLEKATKVSGASPSAQSQARLDLADAELRAADHLILGLSPAPGKGKQLAAEGIDQIEARILDLCTSINAQASRVQANNVAIASLKQLEPKAAQEALAKGVAAAQGGPDSATWITADSGAIPSQAGADAQLAALQQKIDDLTKQQADLTAQRLTAVQQAEQLRNQSETATGRKSVDLFTQSSNLRKQAADLTTQLDGLAAQLTTLNQDAQVAQAQKVQLGNALKVFAAQKDQVAAKWKQTQSQILTLAQSSQELLGGSGAAIAPAADLSTSSAATEPSPATAASNIASASDNIADLASKADALRGKAIEYLQAAVKDYEQSGLASKNLTAAYANRVSLPEAHGYPQASAWQRLLEVHNASAAKLPQAQAWLRLARLYADWSATSAAQSAAAKAVQKAVDAGNTLLDGYDVKLAVPASLNATSLDAAFSSAHDKAEDAYDKADKLLHDVIAAPATNPLSKSARDTARAVQLVAEYGRSQYEAAVGDSANSSKWLNDSKRLRDTMVADNTALPSPLPLEISLTPAVSSTFNNAPATSPASAPAGQPATSPLTATAPTTEAATFDTINTKPDSSATQPEPAPSSEPSTEPATTPAQ